MPSHHRAQQFNIAIIGAGIAGLTAALVLSQRGFRNLHIFERTEQLAEIGAGIQLGPNAVGLLHKMGLASELAEVSDNCGTGQLYRATDDQRLSTIPYSDYFFERYAVPAYQLLRSDLHQLLLNAVRRAGVDICSNKTLVKTEQQSSYVSLYFAEGSQAEADCVIAADGVGSAVAANLFPQYQPTYSGVACWRALIDREALGDHWVDRVSIWADEGRHLVAYPVAQSTKLNLVAAINKTHWQANSRIEKSSKAEWLRAYSGCSKSVLNLIEQAPESELWGLFERRNLPQWHTGNVVLIGDAAHAMLPNLAQGAAQGIEDAVILSEILVNLNSAAEIERGLARFYQKRADRVRRVQESARWNLEFFHAPAGLGRSFRNLAMRSGGAITAQMIASRYHWLYKN